MRKTTILTALIMLMAVFTANINAQTSALWGMTPNGGTLGDGAMFKTDLNGENLSTEYSWENNYDRDPMYVKLCEVNGLLYGTASREGANGAGVLFEYNPTTEIYTSLLDFNNATFGGSPLGGVILANNNKLYGLLSNGGLNNKGGIYEYDIINDTLTVLYYFDGVNSGEGASGMLLQADNGKLYGMTRLGGVNNLGVLFEYNYIDSTYTKLLDFDGATNGAEPYGSLMQADNGKLYGMTKIGGANNVGVIFEYDLNNATYTKLQDFNGDNGAEPYGSLIQADNGNLFGLTNASDYYLDDGVLFEYDIENDTIFSRITFDNNALPYGDLMQASDGNLYGLTWGSGTNGSGTIFNYNIADSSKTVVYNLGGGVGIRPYGTLMQATNGKLYGTTSQGLGLGTIFEFDYIDSTYFDKIILGTYQYGKTPEGSLMQADNGLLYGMTSYGGSGTGVIFEYNPISNIYSKKADFNGDNGEEPYGSLIQADNGKLYGVSEYGGDYGNGLLFEYDIINDTLTVKKEFNSQTGGYSYGSLVKATNGKLYGMNNSDGANSNGTLYEYDIVNDTLTVLVDFNGTNGQEAYASLIQATNGKLYGMTPYGGANDEGVLFEYDIINDTLIVKVSFESSITGKTPNGSLFQATNGFLYGLTSHGGTNDDGTLFEYDILNDTLIVKQHFKASINGENPYGTLMQSCNGNLYGMTYRGGTNGDGVLFEYSITNDTIIVKQNFDATNQGPANPKYGNFLLEVLYPTYGTISPIACNTYIVPSGDETYTSPGTYTVMDTITNMCGVDSIITINLTINTVNTAVTQNNAILTADATGATYQWLDCNNNYAEISGETSQIFTATVNGTYAVAITENGCVDTSLCYTVTISDVETITTSDITIYPNPAHDFVVIENSKFKIQNLEVLDITGKTIKQLTVNNSEFKIQVGDLKQGIYFIKLTTNNTTEVVRFVKK